MNLKNIKVTNLRVAVLLLSLAGIATGLGIGFGIANSTAADISTYTEKKALTTEVISNLTKSYLVDKANVKSGDVYLVNKKTNELELTPQTKNVLVPKANLRANIVYSVGGTTDAPTLTPVSQYVVTSTIANNALYYPTASGGFLTLKKVIEPTIGNVYVNVGTASAPNVVRATYDAQGVMQIPLGTSVSLEAKINASNTEIINRAYNEGVRSLPTGTTHTILEALNLFQHTWAQFTEADVTTMLADKAKYKFKLWVGDRRFDNAFISARVGLVTNWNGDDVKDFDITQPFTAPAYYFKLTFNQDSSKNIHLEDKHSAEINHNDYGAIRGLQVYIADTTPTTPA